MAAASQKDRPVRHRLTIALSWVAFPAMVRAILSGPGYFSMLLLPFWLACATAQESPSRLAASSTLSLNPPSTTPADWNVGVVLGAGPGLSAFGSTQAHDLALAIIHAGKLLGAGQTDANPVLRRLELAGELWGGAQYCPRAAYLVGLSPLLRFRLLPESRWTPFLDGGAGVSATDVGGPDLSSTFQFNLLAGTGLEWRWRSNTSFLLEARYVHLSNGGMSHPNNGLNSLWFGTGLAWFF